MTSKAFRETDLVPTAARWLRERVPEAWVVDVATREDTSRSRRPDASIEIRSPGLANRLSIEVRASLWPRDAERLLAGVARQDPGLKRRMSVLVVAPWLSPRTRELLAEGGVNYVDLTGNALVQLDSPALFIQTQGAQRDPSPTPRGKAGVRGPKAWRLIRTLVDVRPPYGVHELAKAARLAPGYVSRLLTALDEDALIDRSERGRVEAVDMAALFRRWAQSYEVFSSNEASPFLAARGAAEALIADLTEVGRTAVTGSFAAVRLAPVAAPALLAIYCEDVDAVVDALRLIPADRGANVVLLRPFDSIVWERNDERNGIRYVAPPQAAIDCLTGNGRMPAEGEGLLEWMLANEPRWRLTTLSETNR